MIHDKKYITVGDEIINRIGKYIGIVTRKEGVSYRQTDDIKYTISIDDVKTYNAFGNSIGKYDPYQQCVLRNIEPFTAINMYNKTDKVYFKPDFIHMECHEARYYDEVRIVDNYYIERLMEKFTVEHMTVRVESHPYIYNNDVVRETLAIFRMKFYIQKINMSANEITCASQSRSGKKFKAIVPVECVELVKKNNYFKRCSLKRKYKNV